MATATQVGHGAKVSVREGSVPVWAGGRFVSSIEGVFGQSSFPQLTDEISRRVGSSMYHFRVQAPTN